MSDHVGFKASRRNLTYLRIRRRPTDVLRFGSQHDLRQVFDRCDREGEGREEASCQKCKDGVQGSHIDMRLDQNE